MAVKGSGGDLRSISATRLRDPLPRQARSADRALPRRGARRRDGRDLPAVRVRREPRRRLDRHAAARVPAVSARRSPASRLGDRAGRERQRRARSSRSSTGSYGRHDHLGAVAAARVRAGADAEARRRGEPRVRRHRSSAATGCSRGATTQRDCYLNSIRTIDQMGEFVQEHARARAASRALRRRRRSPATVADRESAVAALLPSLRGAVSSNRRVIAHFDGVGRRADVRQLGVGRRPLPDGHELSRSLPAHAHLADVRPVGSGDGRRRPRSRSGSATRIEKYRDGLRRATTSAFAEPDVAGAARRNPSVVVIPGLGLFGFGKDKREARITTEFFVNAIHVMAGANALEDDRARSGGPLPQVRRPEQATQFKTLPQLRRAAADRGVPHRILGARRSEAAADAAREGVQPQGRRRRRRRQRHRPRSRAADRASAAGTSWSPTRTPRAREETAAEAARLSSAEMVHDGGARSDVARHDRGRRCAPRCCSSAASTSVDQHRRDLSDAGSRRRRPRTCGRRTLQINVTSNFVLAQEAAKVLKAQNLPASIVLTSSANAVVPKAGSEAYDVSKAAINHLIRELAIGLGPLVRVNGIAPATVIAGSSMFPRDRVIVALKKYRIAFERVGVDRGAARQARGVLRAAHDHAAADPADRQRQRDLLARRRPERQDHRARDSGRRRAAGGRSCDEPRDVRSRHWLRRVGASANLDQLIVRVDVVDVLRRDQLVLDEHGRRHRRGDGGCRARRRRSRRRTSPGSRRPSRSGACRAGAARRALRVTRSAP